MISIYKQKFVFLEKQIFCSCKFLILRYISAIMYLIEFTMEIYNAFRVLLSCMKRKNKTRAEPTQSEMAKHAPKNFDQEAYGQAANKSVIIRTDKSNFSLVSFNITFWGK